MADHDTSGEPSHSRGELDGRARALLDLGSVLLQLHAMAISISGTGFRVFKAMEPDQRGTTLSLMSELAKVAVLRSGRLVLMTDKGADLARVAGIHELAKRIGVVTALMASAPTDDPLSGVDGVQEYMVVTAVGMLGAVCDQMQKASGELRGNATGGRP